MPKYCSCYSNILFSPVVVVTPCWETNTIRGYTCRAVDSSFCSSSSVVENWGRSNLTSLVLILSGASIKFWCLEAIQRKRWIRESLMQHFPKVQRLSWWCCGQKCHKCTNRLWFQWLSAAFQQTEHIQTDRTPCVSIKSDHKVNMLWETSGQR